MYTCHYLNYVHRNHDAQAHVLVEGGAVRVVWPESSARTRSVFMQWSITLFLSLFWYVCKNVKRLSEQFVKSKRSEIHSHSLLKPGTRQATKFLWTVILRYDMVTRLKKLCRVNPSERVIRMESFKHQRSFSTSSHLIVVKIWENAVVVEIRENAANRIPSKIVNGASKVQSQIFTL